MALLNVIPEMIFNGDCILRNTVLEDAEPISRIWRELGDDPEMICGRRITQADVCRFVNEGDLPGMLGARAELYRMKTVSNMDGEVLGFFDVYHGYPSREVLWINTLMIDRRYWGMGLSRMVLDSLREEAIRAGYTRLGTSVPVLNWPRIRFFLNEGFSQALGLTGDAYWGPGKMAQLCLGQNLEL